MEFNADVADATVTSGSATFGGSQVVFEVPDLEAAPTSFAVVLDLCDSTVGDVVVTSVTYVDDEANAPDMSSLDTGGFVTSCGKTWQGQTNLQQLCSDVQIVDDILHVCISGT